jgi:hypothetical protein
MGPPKGPLRFVMGPPKGPKGPQWGLFASFLGVEVWPLSSSTRATHFSFFPCFFNTAIRYCSVILVSLGPPRTELYGVPGAPKGPQDPFTLILFSYFLPFSKRQTAPTFAFTALSWAASLLGHVLQPLGALLGPLGPPSGPPWAPSQLCPLSPSDYGPADKWFGSYKVNHV